MYQSSLFLTFFFKLCPWQRSLVVSDLFFFFICAYDNDLLLTFSIWFRTCILCDVFFFWRFPCRKVVTDDLLKLWHISLGIFMELCDILFKMTQIAAHVSSNLNWRKSMHVSSITGLYNKNITIIIVVRVLFPNRIIWRLVSPEFLPSEQLYRKGCWRFCTPWNTMRRTMKQAMKGVKHRDNEMATNNCCYLVGFVGKIRV